MTPSRRHAVASMALALVLGGAFDAARAQGVAALQAKRIALTPALNSSAFQRPLVLESVQNAGDLQGDIYAVIEQPYGVLLGALGTAAHWCDLLMLHLNVKNCQVSGPASHPVVDLSVGRKFDQPLDDAYQLAFDFATTAATPEYLRVQMTAPQGPLGTEDYRLSLEAVPADDRHAFVHLAYAYGYGMVARIAMQAYLATAGHDKVGFSVVGRDGDGQPQYVGGVRGVLERNTMRYFLAIEAYLNALGLPASQQAEQRLQDWFTAVERYPRQLHEQSRAEYLAMKRSEIHRQQANAK